MPRYRMRTKWCFVYTMGTRHVTQVHVHFAPPDAILKREHNRLLMWAYRAIFVCPWEIISVSGFYLFYQPMDETNRTWILLFPAKENPNMEERLVDWPAVLQYDVKAISRKFFGHEVFSAERSLNQSKSRYVCICSINQSNRSNSGLSQN